ncbi:MAG TPA: T9SS type A sorting domain-containing protein [Ignavibacteria bacterium]|nr:T9SS type A sorting domain-containing protein [Ignavibacteria bacterium]
MVAYGNYLWVGEFKFSSRILRFSYGPLTSVEDNKLLPEKFNLKQNYPNPFNPSTTISYTIGTGQLTAISKVVLNVYDILGRKVATLVNREQPAGNYKVNFDASKLGSGVYFYRIIANGNKVNFVKTKKMILLR